MNKHTPLNKTLRKHFLSINDSIENYFNKLRLFLSNLKKSKIRDNSKLIGIIGILLISILAYYTIPSFYDNKEIQREFASQIQKKYDIKIKFTKDIKYVILPKPHFVAKNLIILRDDNEIGLAENTKFYINSNRLLNFKDIELKDLFFKKTTFNIYFDDLSFFKKLLETESNENKINITNSKIFFKNSYDEVLFIIKLDNSDFFYDQNSLMNVLNSKSEIFNIPFRLVIKNDKFNKKILTNFTSKKFRLNIENEFEYGEKIKRGLLDILLINKSTSLNYIIDKTSLSFNSESKNNEYKGKIDFKPFYFFADFNYEGLSSKTLLNQNSLLYDLIKTETFNNNNLSVKLKFQIKDIVNIDELNNLNVNLGIEDGNINLTNSTIMWKDDLSISLNESLIDYSDNGINLNGKISINILDKDDFYSSYQIKKIYRKDIKKIEFDFVYNLIQKEFNFYNIRINDKTNTELDKFLEDFNSTKQREFNKITFKNFVNNFFRIYSG